MRRFLRILRKIKEEPEDIQFYVIVGIVLAIVCFIYIIDRTIKLVRRQNTTFETPRPAKAAEAVAMALTIPPEDPADCCSPAGPMIFYMN